MNSNTLPLVSCVCVTHARPSKLRRSIACFLSQTYAHKELVVVCRADDAATLSLMASLEHHSEITRHVIDGAVPRSLGDLRNISIENCRGQYFCQWDDDDWYHPDRIRLQLEAVTRNHQTASILTHVLMYDVAHAQAYFSHLRLWEGSILCRRDVVGAGLKYPHLNRMEDSFFVNALIQRGRVFPLVAPGLYIYEIHRSNTWSKQHFQNLFSAAQPLAATTSRWIGEILSGACPTAEAARWLDSEEIRQQLNCFHLNRLTMSNRRLLEYGLSMAEAREHEGRRRARNGAAEPAACAPADGEERSRT